MSLSALTPVAPAAEPAWARDLGSPLGMPSGRGLPATPEPGDIKKAAAQFEAILLRQLLAPSVEPMMNGGLGASGSGGSGGGGGIYGYLLTDVLSNSLSTAGGLGLAAMLEKQLSPRAAADTSADDPTPNT